MSDPSGQNLQTLLQRLEAASMPDESGSEVVSLPLGELTALIFEAFGPGGEPAEPSRWDEAVLEDDDLFDNARVPLLVTDERGFVVRTNLATDRLVGLPPEEVLGEHVGRFIHAEDYDAVADLWVRMMVDESFDSTAVELRIVTTNGVSWQRAALNATRGEDRELCGIAIQLLDISDKYAAEAALDRSQRQFGNLLDSLPLPVLRLNRMLQVEFGNPAAQLVRTRNDGQWPQVPEDHMARFAEAAESVMNTGQSVTIEHSTMRRGELAWCETTIVGEPHVDGSVKSLLLLCRDITGRHDHQTELAHRARHDTLTGLPNRAHFTDLLNLAVERQRSREAVQESIAVLFLDLDRFKLVNDSLGHHSGDVLLQQVATRLASALRPGDVLGRLGGDEFTVLAHDIDDDGALRLAARLMDQLRAPFELDGRQFIMSASIGVVCAGTPEHSGDLMRWADSAMYRAKQLGRDRIALFDDVLRNEALELLDLDQSLRTAADNGELFIVFQPEVRLDDRRIIGAEALVRWNHPTRGLMDAASFIPLAEENGAVVTIDHEVLQMACDTVARWRASGLVPDDFVLRANLSARQLEVPDLVGVIGSILDHAGLDPRQLCLEITETALMRDVERALVVLTDLHRAGVQLAVDDFGTGYSSLSSLKRFPLDVLKIDKSFISGLPDDPHDDAIVTTVLRLAETLGLNATAEGIETAAQLDRLRTLGCRSGQGYLFARPLPAERFEQLLSEQRSAIC